MTRSQQVETSNATEGCVNCGTLRYAVRAKGYCRDCYELVRQKKQVKAWDAANPRTLRGLPKGGSIPMDKNDPRFFHGYGRRDLENKLPLIKAEKLKELDDRLRDLKRREVRLSLPVDGMDIERRLRTLAKRAGSKNRNVLYGIASEVTATFDAEQRKTLFRWLNEIEESTSGGPRGRRRNTPAPNPVCFSASTI